MENYASVIILFLLAFLIYKLIAQENTKLTYQACIRGISSDSSVTVLDDFIIVGARYNITNLFPEKEASKKEK